MEMYYGSKGVNNYIEVCIKEKDFEISKQNYVLRMLEDNDINGIIKPSVSKLDDDIFFRYYVNSLFVLDKYFIRTKPDINMLEMVLKCISDCIKEAESYLLNVNDLVISPTYMLWDDKNKKIKMIYSPFFGREIRIQLKEFMEYIMQIFDYKSPRGTMKMHRIYELVTEEDFDLNNIIGLNNYTRHEIYSENNNEYSETYKDMDKDMYSESYTDTHKKVSNIIHTDAYEDKFVNENIEVYDGIKDAVIVKENSTRETLIGVNAALCVFLFLAFSFMRKGKVLFLAFVLSVIVLVINSAVYILKKEKEDDIDIDESMNDFKKNMYNYRTKRFDFEETNYDEKVDSDEKDNYYEKTNYSVNTDYNVNKKQYKLIPLNDGLLEPITLNMDKKEIVIGRGKNETDYRLNKEQISRVHARIIIKDEDVYIEDQNSTNGTYINSVKLEAYEGKPIYIGDIIKLANEEFFVG